MSVLASREESRSIRNGPATSWRRDFLITFALVAVSFYLYSHWIWRPTSPDEQTYLSWGIRILEKGSYETAEGNPVTKVPPLHPHLLALAMRLFGPSVDAAQSVSLVFGCLCIALVYWFGRSVWNWRVGLIAALLLLTAAKGEFWSYSNRVLNEIHLTFFVLLTFLWLCLYWRHGAWWMALGSGVSIGLGLLSKEFAGVLLPLMVAGFILRTGNLPRKLVHLAAVMVVVALILLPWLIHVKGVTGSPWGGVSERAKGHAWEALTANRAWGIRPVAEIGKMIRFFDKPTKVVQVLFLISFLYAAWTFPRRHFGEGMVLLAGVVLWFSAFAVFKALPLDFRRLVPMLPLFAILSAVFLDAVWEKREQLARAFRDRSGWSRYILVLLFAVLLWGNMRPARVFRGFQPWTVLSSPQRPFLMREVHEALSCIVEGSRVMSNYDSLVYFYAQGRYPVSHLRTTLGDVSLSWREENRTPGLAEIRSPLIYDFTYEKRRVILDQEGFLRQVRESHAVHLVFFRTRNPRWAPMELEAYVRSRPDVFSPVCDGKEYGVYRIRHAPPGASS